MEKLKFSQSEFEFLYNQGLSFTKIAKALNCSTQYICDYAKTNSIKSNFTISLNNKNALIIDMYNQGLTDSEISNKTGINRSTVTFIRNRNGLPPNFSYDMFKTIDYTKVKTLVDTGKSDLEIAKILKCSKEAIYNIRIKMGYNRDSLAFNKVKELTSYQKQVLIGTLLGDSSLRLSGSANSNAALICAHALPQADIIHNMCNIFNNFTPKVAERSQIHSKTGNKHTALYLRTEANPAFNYYYNLFYINGKKVIPEGIFKDFTAVSLAYMFMDDGSKASCSYKIATCGFTLDDINKFREFLLIKFNLKTSVHKGNTLYIKAESSKTFFSLVYPHTLNCVKYKL